MVIDACSLGPGLCVRAVKSVGVHGRPATYLIAYLSTVMQQLGYLYIGHLWLSGHQLSADARVPDASKAPQKLLKSS